MSSITFSPARLSGSAAVPPAKSEAHRALLLAALGRGECRLNGFSAPLCDDTLAMIDGVRALGGEVRLEDGALIVTPAPPPGKPSTDAPAGTSKAICVPVRGLQRIRYFSPPSSCTASTPF